MIDFDVSLQNTFHPVVCVCFYFYTAFGCHYHEIQNAVLWKTNTLDSLSQQLYILEFKLPFWVIIVLK